MGYADENHVAELDRELDWMNPEDEYDEAREAQHQADLEAVAEIEIITNYVASYAGKSNFMYSMQGRVRKSEHLSPRMLEVIKDIMGQEGYTSENMMPDGQLVNPVEPMSDGFWATTETDTEQQVIYKVQVSQSGNLYAKVLDNLTGKFLYTVGAFSTLRSNPARVKLTLEQAKHLGHLYGRCIVCGRTLTDENSIEAGIGPICAERF